jgi:orotate phosphoribosyltransferase
MESNLLRIFAPEVFIAPLLLILAAGTAGLIWAILQREETRRMVRRRSQEAMSGILQSSHDKVHAGGETDYYFDADVFLGEPANVAKISYWLRGIVDKMQHEYGRFSRLCFIDKAEGPVGAITLKDLLSWQTSIPAVTVRLRGDIPAPMLRIKGKPAPDARGINALQAGERILLVSDVATSGRTIIDAAKILQEAGGIVPVAVVLFDREEGAEPRLRAQGVRLVQYVRRTYVEKYLPPQAEAA